MCLHFNLSLVLHTSCCVLVDLHFSDMYVFESMVRERMARLPLARTASPEAIVIVVAGLAHT